ncbi:cupin domain-containing protein [Rhodococcus opacus]|uniref:Cupin domain-containing protein n=1 Tax=Rhodococcus opacus TaxID=37919 RepID=A0AAX3YQL9_RHOOP|nr:cupin domain-containing protein [Rhodococcus opacus]MCZ4587618.1 cupin domain-containing protein [Rhodococcus opacus]WLF51386.1 cupin domain-containing protein [Rhodococcus opacus]
MTQPEIRRIVTGHLPNGDATILFDGIAKEVLEVPGWTGSWVTELWATDECPVDLDSSEDRARPMRHDPTPQGTLFRIVEVPPENGLTIDTDAAFAGVGSTNRPDESYTSKHPSMHRTDSVDFLVVISGEMTMLMEDGTEARLRPGDCVIQQGTAHAWVNRGTEPCVLAAVLVDARPPAVLGNA